MVLLLVWLGMATLGVSSSDLLVPGVVGVARDEGEGVVVTGGDADAGSGSVVTGG